MVKPWHDDIGGGDAPRGRRALPCGPREGVYRGVIGRLLVFGVLFTRRFSCLLHNLSACARRGTVSGPGVYNGAAAGCWSQSYQGGGLVERHLCFDHSGKLMSIGFARREGLGSQGRFSLTDGQLTLEADRPSMDGFPKNDEGNRTYRCRMSVRGPDSISLSECSFDGVWKRLCRELDQSVSCTQESGKERRRA